MDKVFDSLSPLNRKLLMELKRPARLMKVLGVALRDIHRKHFVELGKPYSNLVSPYLVNTPEYDDFHASVHIVGTGGAIYAHRISGGTVYPKNAKNLSIPLTSKARKWGSPSEGRAPEMFVTKRGRTFFLQERSYLKKVGKRWKKIVSDLQYMLVKSVTHKPDPRASVPESTIFRSVQQTCKDWFEQFKNAV